MAATCTATRCALRPTLAEAARARAGARRRGRARRARSRCIPTGGVVVLKGNLAPDGALIKIAGLKSRVFEGPARVFECEEDCVRGGQRRATTAKATCSSSATKARAAAPACARCSASPRWSTARAWARRSRSSPTAASPARRAACGRLHGPEAAVGGPIALVRDGDRIAIDGERARWPRSPGRRARAPARRLAAAADERLAGVLEKYARLVGPATRRGHARRRGRVADGIV